MSEATLCPSIDTKARLRGCAPMSRCQWTLCTTCTLSAILAKTVQGYLTYKKTHPPRTLP